jgi:hypothetical protein
VPAGDGKEWNLHPEIDANAEPDSGVLSQTEWNETRRERPENSKKDAGDFNATTNH